MRLEHEEVGAPKDAEFRRLVRWLEAGGITERVAAAGRLPEHGPEALEPLLRALHDPRERVRRAAAEALARVGPEAVPPLCTALEDRAPAVRSAAAAALGEVGDERAVAPLSEALRRCFLGRSPWLQVLAGLLVVPAAVLAAVAILLFCIFVTRGHGLDALQLPVEAAGHYFGSRRRMAAESTAIVEALCRIAERRPTPELRSVLPELNVVANDVLHHDSRSRQASRQAARRIRELTDRIKDLPLPAAGAPPPANPATLPLPAEAPEAALRNRLG
jgi:hypothetical protein